MGEQVFSGKSGMAGMGFGEGVTDKGKGTKRHGKVSRGLKVGCDLLQRSCLSAGWEGVGSNP